MTDLQRLYDAIDGRSQTFVGREKFNVLMRDCGDEIKAVLLAIQNAFDEDSRGGLADIRPALERLAAKLKGMAHD